MMIKRPKIKNDLKKMLDYNAMLAIELYKERKKIRERWEGEIERRLAIIEQHLEIFKPGINK